MSTPREHAQNTPRIALIMVVVSDLGGSGGAERLFSHLHEYLTRAHADVTLITATSSLRRLQAAGRLTCTAGVRALALGPYPARGRLGVLRMTAHLLFTTLVGRFDLVHICLPSPIYAPYAALVSRLPASLRPRVTLTVIDCTLADSLQQAPPEGTYERQVLDAHRIYERWARLDGIYSWYRAFVDALGGSVAPLVRAARFCFTDPERFKPAPVKEPLIVFAGRLSAQKRPLVLVDAIARLAEREPALLAGWRVELYGQGVLMRQVAERISRHGLSALVTMNHAIDMAPVFARSRLFVSTQAVENFTSLAMLEAMAAGNAVVAEDVGQTREFVQPGVNGYLALEGSADAFAASIAEFLRHPDRHAALAAASRALAINVHTIEHFADDITAFWRDVVTA